MSALFFTSLYRPDHATGYDYRGHYQGRIAPSGNPDGGFHVLIGSISDRFVRAAAWAPTMHDAKHAMVRAYGGEGKAP